MKIVELAHKIIEKIKPAQIYRERLGLEGGKLSFDGVVFDLNQYATINIVSLGKAAALSAQELYHFLQSDIAIANKLQGGIVGTKYHHGIDSKHFQLIEAAHPVPDENSLKLARELKSYVGKLNSEDLLIVCLSGGASSLAVMPVEEIGFQNKKMIFEQLLKNGAPIEQTNKLRRELSLFKNGGLASECGCRDILVLAISDIPSNAVELIGSGPCYFERYGKDELGELAKQFLLPNLCQMVINYLDSANREQLLVEREERLKEKRITHHILCDFYILMYIAQQEASSFCPMVVSSPLEGDIVAGALAHLEYVKKLLSSKRQRMLISGGEYTVEVKGGGQGGRNMEFVLWLTKYLFVENRLNLTQEQLEKLSFLSVGTDGTDAATKYAGSFINYELFKRAKELNVEEYLANNDSMNYFAKIGGLIETGPTQTNVMDLRMIFIEE